MLRDIPGVFVGGTNGFNQRIYMRGMNHHGLNIQIDGARQQGRQYHHSESLLIDPDILKAVSIDVGSSSVIGNSESLGGSINFTTVSASDLLKPNQTFGFKVKTSYNSNNNSPGGALSLFGISGAIDYLAYISGRWHDFGKTGSHIWGSPGHYRTITDNKFEANYPISNKSYKTGGKGVDINALLKLVLNLDEANRLGLSAELMRYQGIYPTKAEFGDQGGDFVNGKLNDKVDYTPQVFQRQTYTLKYDYTPSEDFELKSNAYYNLVNLDRTRFDKSIYFGKEVELFDSFTHNYGLKSILTNKKETQSTISKIVYGLEYFGIGQLTKNNKKLSKLNESNSESKAVPEKNPNVVNNISVFAEYDFTYKMGNNKIILIPGLRYDFYSFKTDVSINTSDNKDSYPTTSSITNYNNISPAFAAIFKTGAGFGLFANYTRLFKGPSVIEAKRLAEVGTKYGAPEKLKAETGNNFEVGTTFRHNGDLSGVDLTIKGFYTLYDNLILEKRDKFNKQFSRTNSGRADVYGAEAGLRTYVGNASLTLGYTRTFIDYRSFYVGSDKGTVISPETGGKYSANLEYLIQSLDLTLGASMLAYEAFDDKEVYKEQDKQKKDTIKTTFYHKPGFFTTDIYAVWEPEFMDGFVLNFGIYNLFNESYISQTSRFVTGRSDYEPGISARVSVAYKY